MIPQVVQELTLLGFSPERLQNLLSQGNDVLHLREAHNPDEHAAFAIQSHATTESGFKLSYEVENDSGQLVPRLRLIVDKDIDLDTVVSET